MKFVIIGGDAAGMSAASRAKRSMPDMEIIVLEKTEDVSYSACGMPYNIADASREMDDLVVRSADVFRQKQDIDLRTGHVVECVDPGSRLVSGTIQGTQASFSFSYDRLLIATGGRSIIPDLPGFDLPGVLALKSLKDGKTIKTYLNTHAVKKSRDHRHGVYRPGNGRSAAGPGHCRGHGQTRARLVALDATRSGRSD